MTILPIIFLDTMGNSYVAVIIRKEYSTVETDAILPSGATEFHLRTSFAKASM